MALETKLVQKLGQSLLMTPQLQQAIKLLQLGRLEYIEAIEKELLENPILEEMKDSEDEYSNQTSSDSSKQKSEDQGTEAPDAPEAKVDWEDYLESFTDSRGMATPKGLTDFDGKPSLEAVATKEENLQDHLLSQLRFFDLKHDEKQVIMEVIGNLNKYGYLCVTNEEIAESCQCSLELVEQATDTVKSLDPAGIGAKDLSECLFIQLDRLGLGEQLAGKIVLKHLDKLEKRKYDSIAKEENVQVEDVYQAIVTIQSLNPRPGRQFSDDPTRYVIPDIYIYKISGEYVISLNEDGLPKLRVSPYYLDVLKSKDSKAKENKAYLNERLKAASWLIKSIHQRQQTIYKVTESIVKYQKDFLDKGVEKLKPLVLKEVADDIGMHESTVSRVTTNKYVHTPQGVFELKYFFTTGIKTMNGDVSSSAIKERIKNLIGAEEPDNPLSDQAIVEILKEEEVFIARRTVAKYRENLNILSSSKRKKFF